MMRKPVMMSSGRGKPRGVNRLAIAALIAGCAAGKNLIDEASARSAVAETNHDTHPARDTLTTARHRDHQQPRSTRSSGANSHPNQPQRE